MSDYKGWKIPEKVIIVAKAQHHYVYSSGEHVFTGEYQGYVVDANNSDMLESAHRWADWTEHVKDSWDPETHAYKETIEHPGIDYLFDNEGFTLQILDSANGSSQGGKLSFWNCKITKDDKSFIIGIHSDYLLDILLCNTFVNGKCETPLMFARSKSGVGMTTKDMPIYKEFLSDEEKRAKMKKGKTKKRIRGHLYSTLTGGEVYLGKFYRWYEPIYTTGGYYWQNKCVGFRKLQKPIVQYWSPWHDDDRCKTVRDHLNRGLYWSSSITARVDEGPVVEIDMTEDEILSAHNQHIIQGIEKGYEASSYWLSVGVSTSDKEYTMPEELRKIILEKGYALEE